MFAYTNEVKFKLGKNVWHTYFSLHVQSISCQIIYIYYLPENKW